MDESDEREKILGFKPQKEIIYNTLLPYKEDVDLESNEVLAEIKANLGRAVQLRDLKVGAGHWVGQLSRYIRLYGLKFSKEDHVKFIQLLYELTVVPDLELSMVQKFAQQLSSLLKKKKLLTREDLTLQWRPLYRLLESVLYSTYENHGLLLAPANIEQILKSLVRDCRMYFPAGSTLEMLDEWRPLLCPFDVTVIKGLQYLELFLPTNPTPEEMDTGFRLWFKELMDMWDSFQNNPSWERCLISLMSKLAHNNIGYIDWSPYVAKVFTRLLRSFNLPVGTTSVQVSRLHNQVNIESYIIWIISMMGGENVVQDHIDKLFTALQNFYHPSNLGKWNISDVDSEFQGTFEGGRSRGRGRSGSRGRGRGRGSRGSRGERRGGSRGSRGSSRGRGGRSRSRGKQALEKSDKERLEELWAERKKQTKKVVGEMGGEELRELVLKLVDREPGLVFDLCEAAGEPDNTPPPPPSHGPSAPSWCKCGNCRPMATDLESKCCGCLPRNCISDRDEMERLVLDPQVLAIGQRYYRDMLGRHRQRVEDQNKTMRHSGYRNFTLWRHGRLGAGVRRVIPSCSVLKIRGRYPSASGQYTGFIPSRYI